VAQTLARAFYDDDFWQWFMPDDATRLERLERMFSTFARQVYLRHGDDCYTTDTYEGAALWAPPGHEELSTGDVLRVFPGWARAIGYPAFRAPRRASRPKLPVKRPDPANTRWFKSQSGSPD
jgi:hypothetical protein